MDINALNYFYHIRPFKAYFLRDWNGGIQYPALEVYGVKLPYQNECSWLYVRAHLVCLIKLGAIYIVRCRISGIFDPLPPCTQGLLHKWRHIYEVLYAKAKPLPSPSLQRTMCTAPLLIYQPWLKFIMSSSDWKVLTKILGGGEEWENGQSFVVHATIYCFSD